MITLLTGDCRDVLSTLADRSVQCIVTSPPYYGLRRYDVQGQQIGLEPTPAEYVAALVAVFRACRRVLRDDGVLWVNLGDSYAMDSKWGGASGNKNYTSAAGDIPRDRRSSGLADKNLLGIPWKVAFALQDDGWILRSDIIWSKPNPMPESVADRPTRAHEYLFLFAKQARYFYDAAAIRENAAYDGRKDTVKKGSNYAGTGVINQSRVDINKRDVERWQRGENGEFLRNRRSVWTVATRPYSGAHFAVFPEQLIAPCILAGSASQACERCGAPWGRVIEREGDSADRTRGAYATEMDRLGKNHLSRANGFHGDVKRTTLGFRPSCACDALGSARSVVLDPFVGSGTTCRVAEKYGRDSIGIDLGYKEIQDERTDGIQQDMEGLL